MSSSVPIHLKHQFLHLLHHKASLFSPLHLLQIHSHLITTGLHADPSLLFKLLHLCSSKPSLLNHATLLFDSIQRPDAAAWRVMIRGHASGSDPLRSLHLFKNLQNRENASGPSPLFDDYIYASAVKACGRLRAIREGKSIHCRVLRYGLDSSLNIQNTLIHFYSNLANSISSACNLFDEMPCRTIVTVNCLISGFLKNGLFDVGLNLFKQILDGSLGEVLRPNDVTLVIMISGCDGLGNLSVGKSLHCYCCKSIGFSMISVWNALIDWYATLGCMDNAENLFRGLPENDLVSWNSLIAGYRKNNDADKAVSLFREMRSRGIEGDRATLVSLISACAQSKDLAMGMWVHAHLKRRVKIVPVPLATALINMYFKCGLTVIAQKIFDEMPGRNIVSWNSMILGYAENQLFSEALSLFGRIQMEDLAPDEVTMLGLISACQNSGAFDHCDLIHYYIQSYGLDGNIKVCNALIDMFVKFGCMDRAESVFKGMLERDVVTWTSMIVGYAVNGNGRKALEFFWQMSIAGVEPNSITFIGILSACDHAGLVDDGRNLYSVMCLEYGIKPEIEHCGCMVDLLARAGLVDEAREFVKNMPVKPNAVVWRMLIGACRAHGEIGLGEHLVNGLIELSKSSDPEDYVISSNTFAEAGRWNDVLLSRRLMGARKVLKTPGRSSISGAIE